MTHERGVAAGAAGSLLLTAEAAGSGGKESSGGDRGHFRRFVWRVWRSFRGGLEVQWVGVWVREGLILG